ncbi:glycosyltransferase family 2 protein [Flavobacteriaceae bacterium]|jgi:GT2 family glycosyltransferase|nr:glycosyltransferase family 2 protein [Flavobacteriaceae bacterium]MDB4050550.1 glycosyltransferase family 2 protein [Flavobacteriaceae bacterium]MDB4086505.1 glycosyltransferase family 2 protein [Flavobacteriaceae bacterium]MDB9787880.1 glycosyltransferase family 2 protein [Flavobacteriaceae bacterium]
MKIAIVILNWNGLNHLKKFLPSVTKYSGKNPIYIIDNSSTDSSFEFIKETYPEIKLILNIDNFGYAKGYNEGLKKVKEEVYCLLNNDVEVTKDWLNPIIEEFSNNESVVIAQPKILDYKIKNKFEYAGAAGGFIDYFGYPYCRGRIFNNIEKDNGQYDQNIDIFWASGACFFIRKNTYELLNGFDENFINHMEEIDLCWRLTNLNPSLKKRFLFKSVVFHLGGGSLDYENPKKLFYNIRNQRWMLIKNMDLLNTFSLTIFVVQSINLFMAAYYLIINKIKHFKEIFKAMFQNSIIVNEKRLNISKSYSMTKLNKTKPKHFVIKSILYQFIIRGRKKYSDLT